MPRIMLTVAYDGTGYNGFASQKDEDAVTIEGVLNKALHSLTGENIEVIGASRTDAGVHALGNLAVFDTCSTIPPERFSYAVNRLLPEDIRIMKSEAVADNFHPRHMDTVKTYEYHIWNSDMELPTRRLYSYWFSFPLDVDRMQEAGQYLVGEHDFTSFCNAQSQALTHVRTIYSIQVRREGKEVIIEVKGSGFLYNMVRIIAGTLLMIGRGKGEPSDISGMLEARDRSAAGPTAPANGLFLIGYSFGEQMSL